MAKEKLFSTKDFDKEPPNPKKNHTAWIITAIIAVISIIVFIFCIRQCKGHKDDQMSEKQLSIANPANDSTVVEKVTATVILDQKENDKAKTNQITSKIEENHPSSNQTTSVTKQTVNIETEALKVIRGTYGNNPERKATLGSNYQSIQNRVNELKRQGFF